MIRIRPAKRRDIAAIHTFLEPAVAAGEILPPLVSPETFLIALQGHEIVGSVALSPLNERVAELGSLVSRRPGQGLGRRLVEAAIKKATSEGFEVITALTALPGFFQSLGFQATSYTPWMIARRALDLEHPLPIRIEEHALQAAEAKAAACQLCQHLKTCHQVQTLHVIPQRQRRLG